MNTENYGNKVLSFVRWSQNEKLIVTSNFDNESNFEFDLKVPKEIIGQWQLSDGDYQFKDQLYNKFESTLKVKDGLGIIKVQLKPLESFILKLN